MRGLVDINVTFAVSKTCHWHLFEKNWSRLTKRNLFYLKKVPSFIRLAPYKLPSQKTLNGIRGFRPLRSATKGVAFGNHKLWKAWPNFLNFGRQQKKSRISPTLNFLIRRRSRHLDCALCIVHCALKKRHVCHRSTKSSLVSTTLLL